MTKDKSKICSFCGHSLVNNPHGLDQNDVFMDGDKLIHSGSCTYCKHCRAGNYTLTETPIVPKDFVPEKDFIYRWVIFDDRENYNNHIRHGYVEVHPQIKCHLPLGDFVLMKTKRKELT